MGFRNRYKNKRDANEPQVVDAFRALGCSVHRLDQPVDLLVGFRGRSYAVEVKQEGETLNEKQRAWRDEWRGDCWIVRSVEDVREVVAEWRAQK